MFAEDTYNATATGASRKRSRIDYIFLDEIGELSLDLQAKLLRVLQEGEFESVGSSQTLKVDRPSWSSTVAGFALVSADEVQDSAVENFRLLPVSRVPAVIKNDSLCTWHSGRDHPHHGRGQGRISVSGG